MREALEEIESMPFSMANDSESLRHTIRTMQQIARNALQRPREYDAGVAAIRKSATP